MNAQVPSEVLQATCFQERLNEIHAAIADERTKRAAATQLALAAAAPPPEAPGGCAPVRDGVGGGPETVLDLDDDDDAVVQQPEAEEAFWHHFAERTVKSMVLLLPEPKTPLAVKDMLRDCHLGATRGETGSSHVLVHYDVKLSGEPITAPHYRSAPLRKEALKTAVAGVLQARGGLLEGDMYVFNDAGKHGIP
ncbi:MAG: hypothetical protein GY772_22900 [bacterium]|nr:hypothetical protein [bacterium]